MIEALLPPGVAVESTVNDPPGLHLYPEEETVIHRAVDKRRREFSTVRQCARIALNRLGQSPGPLVPDRRGATQWPVDIVGSMTHCAGYRAAAVASALAFSAIGIDAEPDDALPDDILTRIARPAEQAWIDQQSYRNAEPAVHWDRLLFSAKESVFKAWYPATGRELDFDEAEIAFDQGGTFEARLLVAGPVSGYQGRWLACAGLLLTAIASPAV